MYIRFYKYKSLSVTIYDNDIHQKNVYIYEYQNESIESLKILFKIIMTNFVHYVDNYHSFDLK